MLVSQNGMAVFQNGRTLFQTHQQGGREPVSLTLAGIRHCRYSAAPYPWLALGSFSHLQSIRTAQ